MRNVSGHGMTVITQNHLKRYFGGTGTQDVMYIICYRQQSLSNAMVQSIDRHKSRFMRRIDMNRFIPKWPGRKRRRTSMEARRKNGPKPDKGDELRAWKVDIGYVSQRDIFPECYDSFTLFTRFLLFRAVSHPNSFR